MRPLAALPNALIVHVGGAIYKVGPDLQGMKLLCSLPATSFVTRLAKHFRLLDRVFRASPNHAAVFDNMIFIARRSEIWCYDLKDGRLSLDFRIPDNRRSLGFGFVSHSDGSEEIVFGEYFSNPTRLPVRIWGRKAGPAKWVQRAKFAEGQIEHVHALTCINGQVFVLTGDFGQAAGIWIADTNFDVLRPLVRGQQSFRAAWMEAIDGRIFMATDTQLELNQLYGIQMGNSGEITFNPLLCLDGSSIYAGRGPADIFFSTTVECGEPTGNLVRDLLDTRLGPGMLSSKATLMTVDRDGRISQIYSAEKDAWPFRLAQFGTFTFPAGNMPPDTLFAYGVALNGVDDTCMVFHRSK
jgi:hypothetical protein